MKFEIELGLNPIASHYFYDPLSTRLIFYQKLIFKVINSNLLLIYF